jgi:hypothetical protein
MSVLKNLYEGQSEMEIEQLEILSHTAWHGDLSGMECEDILRGLLPGSFLLRAGERKFQYYLSYVVENSFTFKHQPFSIAINDHQTGWGYRNGSHHWAATLDLLIPVILHRPFEECIPIAQKNGS